MQQPASWFELQFKTQGIYLTIYPSKIEGDFDPEPILEVLWSSDYSSFQYQFRTKTFEELCNKDWTRINQKVVVLLALKQEYELDVQITPDKLKAYVTITKAYEGEYISKEHLQKRLKEKGVVFGLIPSALQAIEDWEEGLQKENFLVARGLPADKGEAGWYEQVGLLERLLPFDPEQSAKIHELSEGHILLQKHGGKKAQTGKTVTGAILNPPQFHDTLEPMPLQGAKKASYNANILVSSASGYPVHVFHTARVDQAELYQSPTESIVANHSCIIQGPVSKIWVQSKGNIEVFGEINDVVLEAEGNIYLHGKMNNMRGSRLKARGSIFAYELEKTFVECGAELYVQTQVKDCQVFVFGPVLILGQLAGGTLHAFSEINIETLGTYKNAITQISFAENHYFQNAKKAAYEDFIQSKTDLQSHLKQVIHFHTNQSETIKQVTQRTSDAMWTKKALSEQLNFFFGLGQPDTRLKIKNAIYPGVQLLFPHHQYTQSEKRKGPLNIICDQDGVQVTEAVFLNLKSD